MKTLNSILKLAVFAVLIGLFSVSCSSDDNLFEQNNIENISENQSNEDLNTELILYINESAPLYSSYRDLGETRGLRGFLRWLRNVIKCDAMGYLWGISRGCGLEGSLIPSVACSIAGAIQLSSANGITTSDWNLNTQWNTFPTSPDYYKIGYDHNKAIFNMHRSNPQLFSMQNSSIISTTVSSLKKMGYSSNITSLEYTTLLATLSQSYESFDSYIKTCIQNTPYISIINVLDTYAANIVNFTSDSQIISYTSNILSQIDSMGISNAKAMKAAILICGNSRILWKEK